MKPAARTQSSSGATPPPGPTWPPPDRENELPPGGTGAGGAGGDGAPSEGLSAPAGDDSEDPCVATTLETPAAVFAAALWSVSTALLATDSRPNRRRDASLAGPGTAGADTGGFGTTGVFSQVTGDEYPVARALVRPLSGRGTGR